LWPLGITPHIACGLSSLLPLGISPCIARGLLHCRLIVVLFQIFSVLPVTAAILLLAVSPLLWQLLPVATTAQLLLPVCFIFMAVPMLLQLFLLLPCYAARHTADVS